MEGFFLKSLQADLQTVEFAYKTYGNTLDLLPFDWGIRVIEQGFESARRDKYWMLYCQVYPSMTSENFMEFEAFVKELTAPPAPEHTAGEILEKVERISKLRWKKEAI